ncbi:MAG: hypothetical protein JXQ73_09260 [Phycisphaerae bacterium]|nr:hypothetical protein [Phycisphaerae bacterium]
MRLGRCAGVVASAMLAVGVCGCSPLSAVSYGAKFVGHVVDDKEVRQKADDLVGLNPSAADDAFGERIDTLRDVRSDRQWLVYPVRHDPLHQHRYVVEVSGGRIVAVAKTQKDAKPEMDIPETMLFKERVGGRPVAECEGRLKLGPPLLTVRSEASGCLSQIYDAQLLEIEGVTRPRHCVLRFDRQGLCEKVELITVDASSGGDPLAR